MAKIQPIPDYPEHMGVLVGTMVLTRMNTLFLVRGLSVNELDFNLDDMSNSIGTLLLHISALEYQYTLTHLIKKKLPVNEWKKYDNALGKNMDKRLVKNNELNFYIEEMSKVRDITLKALKSYDDNWLFQELLFSSGFSTNNYCLLRHVIDDELCHQGQIKLIKRRINSI